MKKTILLLALLLAATGARAQRFEYDVRLDYLFNNGSYNASKELFESNKILHGLVFTPLVGVSVRQFGNVSHRAMIGIDVIKEFGIQTPHQDMFKEIVYFYNLEARLRDGGVLSGIAGCFPTSFLEHGFTQDFFSDEIAFRDRNFEGFGVKYRNRRLYADLAFDTFSRRAEDSRERMQLMATGEWNFFRTLSLGWTAYGLYFGPSDRLQNTVYFAKAFAYLKWAPKTDLQALSVSAGWVQTYHRDMAVDGEKLLPGGLMSIQEIRHWNFGLQNNLYFGQDLMPLYAHSYQGVRYAADLYFGKRFYHTQIEGFSLYDRAELYWEPRLADWVTIRFALAAHLGNPTNEFGLFRGWQQIVSVKFNLGSLRPSKIR